MRPKSARALALTDFGRSKLIGLQPIESRRARRSQSSLLYGSVGRGARNYAARVSDAEDAAYRADAARFFVSPTEVI